MLYKIIGDDQKVYGPATVEQIRQWQAEGRVNGATLLQAEGSTEWKPLSSMPEFGIPPAVSMPPSTRKGDDGMAVSGLVFGILSIVGCVSGLFGMLGVIFSLVALNRHESHAQGSRRSMAVAGLILSIIGLACRSFNFNWPGHLFWWHHYWRH